MAEITQSFSPEPCILRVEKRSIVLNVAEVYTIGRKELNTICIKDSQISGQHAKLSYQKDAWWIQDLKSRNGILINGKKIETASLQHGDIIRIGETSCIFYSNKTKIPKIKQSSLMKICWITFGIVGLLLLGIAYTPSPSQTNNDTIQIHGNLLEDYSFEDAFAWEFGPKMQIQPNLGHSGQHSLVFQYTNQAPITSETFYNKKLRVSYKKNYLASVWLQTQALIGHAGLKFSWFAQDKRLGDSYSQTVQGTQSWQKIEFLAIPPPNADEFQVSCIVMGVATAVAFDDVVILEQNAPSHISESLDFAGLQFHVDSRGMVRIYHASGEFCDLGIWELCNISEPQTLLVTQKIAYAKERQAQFWSGVWNHPYLSKSLEGKIFVEKRDHEKNIVISYQMTLSDDDSQVSMKYRLFLPNLGRIVRNQGLSDGSKIFEPEIVCFFPKAKKKVSLVYSLPLEWNVQTLPSEIGYTGQTIVLPENRKLSWQIFIQVTDLEDRKQLQQYLFTAQEERKLGNLGKATILYQKITQNSIFPEFDFVYQEAQQVEKLWLYDNQQIRQMWEQSRFFNSPKAYSQLLEKSKPLLRRWQDYPKFSQLQEIINGFMLEYERLLELEYNRESSQYFSIAQNLQKEGNQELAKAVHQFIQENFPKSLETKTIQNKTNGK